VVAWAFYDWANSAFATTVMAGFFPVFFKQYWNAGVAPPRAPSASGSPTASPS
jgi:MFS transporter, UMF1 family